MVNADSDGLHSISEEDWKAILLRLHRYTVTKCRILPADIEPDDIASEALRRVLQNSRKWNKEKQPDIFYLLTGTVDSILSKLWSLKDNKHRMRETFSRTNITELEKYSEEMTPEEEENWYDVHLKRLQKIVEGDEELEYFLLAIESKCDSYETIAKTLDWDIQKVYRVKRRMKDKVVRELVKKRVEDDE